ncbi:RNA-directed DNA polymerase-like protein, partial [Dinothrombium tinctorium]
EMATAVISQPLTHEPTRTICPYCQADVMTQVDHSWNVITWLICCFEISEQQVKKCIFKQSSFEAVGVDEINGYMLKLSCEYIAPHITTLINCIIKSGKYPAKWKIARVFPVYKNRGSKYDKSNYGPISILSSMSKIMKNYLHDIISNHLENQKLISPNQYGFQKGKST